MVQVVVRDSLSRDERVKFIDTASRICAAAIPLLPFEGKMTELNLDNLRAIQLQWPPLYEQVSAEQCHQSPGWLNFSAKLIHCVHQVIFNDDILEEESSNESQISMVIVQRCEMAIICLQHRRFDDARKLQLQVPVDDLPADSPERLLCNHQLAIIFHLMGNGVEAIRMLKEIVNTSKSKSSDNSDNYITILATTTLALIYWEEDKDSEAAQMLKELSDMLNRSPVEEPDFRRDGIRIFFRRLLDEEDYTQQNSDRFEELETVDGDDGPTHEPSGVLTTRTLGVDGSILSQ